MQPSEGDECDDHNHANGDGCSATCQLEDGCGDGNLDPGEECDDDNLVNGDTCSSTCQVLVGCGNGAVTAGEQCDDDNVASGDGCSSTCQFELFGKYSFTGALGNEVSSPPDATPDDPNTVLSNITRGSGISPNAIANTFGATGFGSPFDANDYVQIVITPNALAHFTLLRIAFDHQHSGTGPTSMAVRTSADNFVADLYTGTAGPSTTLNHFDLPVSGFANLAAPLTIRIYGFGASAGGGTYRIDNIIPFGFSSPN